MYIAEQTASLRLYSIYISKILYRIEAADGQLFHFYRFIEIIYFWLSGHLMCSILILQKTNNPRIECSCIPKKFASMKGACMLFRSIQIEKGVKALRLYVLPSSELHELESLVHPHASLRRQLFVLESRLQSC